MTQGQHPGQPRPQVIRPQSAALSNASLYRTIAIPFFIFALTTLVIAGTALTFEHRFQRDEVEDHIKSLLISEQRHFKNDLKEKDFGALQTRVHRIGDEVSRRSPHTAVCLRFDLSTGSGKTETLYDDCGTYAHFSRATLQSTEILLGDKTEARVWYALSTPYFWKDPFIRLMLIAFGVAIILAAVAGKYLVRSLQREIVAPLLSSIEQSARLNAIAETASQVAHDIRSPLTALCVVNDNLAELPEEKRLLVRSAIVRIQDIANNLITIKGQAREQVSVVTDSTAEEAVQTSMLSSLIESVVSEKRLLFHYQRAVQITAKLDSSAYGFFARVQPMAFKRVLSNLVNNAIESLRDKGHVEVTMAAKRSWIEIKITDNGKGIPAEVLPKLMKKGASFDKRGGSGLGLYHAKERVKSWGGELAIQSEFGRGTKVCLRLKATPPPAWFISALLVKENTTVIVLDDDTSIHQTWRTRFESAGGPGHGIQLHNCTRVKMLTDLRGKQAYSPHPTLYLIDYELIGEEKNGLEIISELRIENESILVTSHHEEREILDECDRLNIKVIPKSVVPLIPINLLSVPQSTQPYLPARTL